MLFLESVPKNKIKHAVFGKCPQKHLKEIAIILSKECNLTHEEIASKFKVSRIKITRIINEKWTKSPSICSLTNIIFAKH